MLPALSNIIVRQGLYDRDFLVPGSNAPELVNMDEGSPDCGLFVRRDIRFEEGCCDPRNRYYRAV